MTVTAEAPNNRTLIPHVVILIALVVALLLAGGAGYYSVMRWMVCAAFVLLALESRALHQERWIWIWGVLAGIYNPIVPVHASKSLWILIDVSAIGITAFDLFIRHESLLAFRRSAVAATKWLWSAYFRLSMAIICLILVLLVTELVITRWG